MCAQVEGGCCKKPDPCCPPEAPDCCGGICTVDGDGCGIVPGDCTHLCPPVCHFMCISYLSFEALCAFPTATIAVRCRPSMKLCGSTCSICFVCFRRSIRRSSTLNRAIHISGLFYSPTYDAFLRCMCVAFCIDRAMVNQAPKKMDSQTETMCKLTSLEYNLV
jgi:hypothetical protein